MNTRYIDREIMKSPPAKSSMEYGKRKRNVKRNICCEYIFYKTNLQIEKLKTTLERVFHFVNKFQWRPHKVYSQDFFKNHVYAQVLRSTQ